MSPSQDSDHAETGHPLDDGEQVQLLSPVLVIIRTDLLSVADVGPEAKPELQYTRGVSASLCNLLQESKEIGVQVSVSCEWAMPLPMAERW